MRFTPQQDAALLDIRMWLADPGRQVYRLFGYAGTGKTTMAKHIAEGVDGTVLTAAYTGKAAHVLHQKGCPNATTIHSLAYVSAQKSQSRLTSLEADLAEAWAQLKSEAAPDEDLSKNQTIRALREQIEEEKRNLTRPMFRLNHDSPLKTAKLSIIDECSMVDTPMGEDIESFGCKLLVLGDPAQLPPIMGGGYFTNHKPDFMLTDIQRQARDNPIIEMARIVREGGTLSLGAFGDSRVLDRRDSTPELAMSADQILVGKNATRQASNHRMRSLLGRDDKYPEQGDKLVCLRNNHDMGLLNGSIWHVNSCQDEVAWLQLEVHREDQGPEEAFPCLAWKHHFLKNAPDIPWWERKEANEFDYGYALTVHKSQGSQWNNVLLYDEWHQRDTRRQWLYTAITRAAERIDVVRM